MSIETLTEEQIKLSREMVKFSLKFCSACYFGNPSDEDVKVNNGTMTLVQYGGERYGITNFHVVDAYRERLKNESDIDFYIGSTQINLDEALIDEDKDLDLCTFKLSAYGEECFGFIGEIQGHFYELDDFSNGGLKEGDFVLFGGFPGVWRERPKSNHLIFDSLSLAQVVLRSLKLPLEIFVVNWHLKNVSLL